MKPVIVVLAVVGFAACIAALPTTQHSEQDSDVLTLEELEALFEVGQTIDENDEVITYGLGKKLRKGLKKVGKVIEGAAKKALEHGIPINISFAVTFETEVKDDTTFTLEELGNFIDEIKNMNEEPEMDTTYGLGKKLRKGLKKVGKVLEKGAKKVLDKGVSVTVRFSIPIPFSLNGRPNKPVASTF